MFLFKKHKKFNHKHSALVGLVLAVMSLLVTAIFVYIVPLIPAWLYSKGVYSLDLMYMLFVAVMFMALQALILFGFPLFYAQDKKSHMTGFQILLYALGWEVVIMAVVTLVMVGLTDPTPTYDVLEDIDWEAFEQALEEDVEVTE